MIELPLLFMFDSYLQVTFPILLKFQPIQFTTGNYSSRSVWSCNAKIGHLIRMAVQTLNRLVCSGADLHDAECDEKLGPGRAPGGLLRLVLAAVSSHRHASKKVLPLGGVSRRIDRSSRCRRHRTRRFRGVSLRLLWTVFAHGGDRRRDSPMTIRLRKPPLSGWSGFDATKLCARPRLD